MAMPLMTQQVESRRPLSQTCKDACLVHIYPTGPGMGSRYTLAETPVVLGRGGEAEVGEGQRTQRVVAGSHDHLDVPGGAGLAVDRDGAGREVHEPDLGNAGGHLQPALSPELRCAHQQQLLTQTTNRCAPRLAFVAR